MSSPKDAERNQGQQDPPHDEFDDIPYDARYYGTHRKAVPQVRQRNSLKWVIFAGVLALIIGAFSFLILPTLTGADNDNGNQTESEQTQTEQTQTDQESGPTEETETSDEQSPEQSPEETETEPETSPTQSPTQSPTEEETESTPAANVNYGLNVEVYNTAAAPGAAAQAGQTLRNEGFTVPVTANWQGFAVATSTVYYASEDQRDTAQAVAESLGIGNVEQRQVPAIVVVLASNQ